MNMKKKIFKILLVLGLMALVAAPGYYFYNKYQEAQAKLDSPAEVAKTELKEVLDRVSVLIELPSDEEPTLATVSDKEKLVGQSFFAKAENGDKLLIYVTAKKAILYRPSTNKIIEVSVLAINDSTPTPQTAAKVKVALLNGTNVSGLTKTAETKLNSLGGFAVAEKGNAIGKFEFTTLIALNKQIDTRIIQSLASAYGASVSADLPTGETGSKTADLVMILGENFK